VVIAAKRLNGSTNGLAVSGPIAAGRSEDQGQVFKSWTE
jgi:hypothetical protein